jgi:hypothetical protein
MRKKLGLFYTTYTDDDGEEYKLEHCIFDIATIITTITGIIIILWFLLKQPEEREPNSWLKSGTRIEDLQVRPSPVYDRD